MWPAAKLFSYAFVPVPLRPLFGDLVGFFWAIFLSTMTQASKKKQEKKEGSVDDGDFPNLMNLKKMANQYRRRGA